MGVLGSPRDHLRRALGSDEWYTRRIRVQLVRSLASPRWCLEDRSGPGGSILHTCSAFRRSSTSISREVRTASIAELEKLDPHAVVHVISLINTQELCPFLPPHRAQIARFLEISALKSIGPAPQTCRPRRLFRIKPSNYQASSAGEAVPWTAPRGRWGAWIDLGCWRWDPGTVVNSPISCRSLCDGRVEWFRVPTAAPAQASRGGQSGLLGAAASLLRPGCLSYKHCAPAGRRASSVCRFLHHISPPPTHAPFRALRLGRESFLFVPG